VHKRGSGIKGSLRKDNRSFVCKCCTAGSQTLAMGDEDKHLDIGDKFCYQET